MKLDSREARHSTRWISIAILLALAAIYFVGFDRLATVIGYIFGFIGIALAAGYIYFNTSKR